MGDINQSIFGFRHAEPQGFPQYRDDVAARGRHLVELVDNFRSRAGILSAVETVTARRCRASKSARWWPGRKFDDAAARIGGSDLRAAGRGGRGAVGGAPHSGVLDEGFEFQDIAVLVRNTEVIGEFTRPSTRPAFPTW